MTHRRQLAFGAALVLAAAGGLWLWSLGPQASKPSPAPSPVLPGQPAAALQPPVVLATRGRPPLADAIGAPGTKPEAEPKLVLELLVAYRRLVGDFPVGEDNRQIVRALLGANAKRLPVLPRDHPRLSPRGELVDAWGRPFFFHLISREHVEVRSAGPDREFYTGDDILAGKQPAPPTVGGSRK